MEMDKHWPSDETLAAFLEGSASASEVEAVLAAAKTDALLREYLSIAGNSTESIPMLAQAATGERDKL